MAYDMEHLIVKIIGAYCIIAYILVVSLLLGHWCKPVEQYWALPVENCTSTYSAFELRVWFRHLLTSHPAECATYYKHMIFATAFNISSDLMLLGIPIPIVIRSQLPLKR